MGWKGIALIGAGLFAGYLMFSPKAETPRPMALLETTGLKPLPVSAPIKPPKPSEKKPEPKPKSEVTKALTTAAIAALLVDQSRNAYHASGRPCACPDDRMRNGRRCGANSAYSKPGGAQPLCSVSDVSAELIEKYRARLSQRTRE
jgi:hypothetical protein